MRSILREMKKKFAIIESSLRSTIDEPYYIEITVRDARQALDIYADMRRNLPDVTIYGSNVYASFEQDQIEDLLNAFEQQAIEISETSLDTDLDEQNVTGAVAGYSTPNAFRKKVKKVGYASGMEESINTPSQSKIKDNTTKPHISDILESKYEQLVEGYRSFANGDSKKSPEQKVKHTIKEIAQKLREIETLVNYNSKLKTESGVTSSVYGPGTSKALTEISKRLIKISERVRSLGE